MALFGCKKPMFTVSVLYSRKYDKLYIGYTSVSKHINKEGGNNEKIYDFLDHFFDGYTDFYFV